MAQLDSTICIQVNEISNLTLTFYWYMYCLFWFSGYGNPTASNVVLLWASQSYSYNYESDHCNSSCDDYKQVREVFGQGVLGCQYLTYTFFFYISFSPFLLFIIYFYYSKENLFARNDRETFFKLYNIYMYNTFNSTSVDLVFLDYIYKYFFIQKVKKQKNIPLLRVVT